MSTQTPSKPLFTSVFLLLAFGVAAHAAPKPIEGKLLKPTEWPPECRLDKDPHFPGIKTQTMYESEAYEAAMPGLTDKRLQSATCGSEKGSLLYFQFSTPAERENAMLFTRTMMSIDLNGEKPMLIPWQAGFLAVGFRRSPAPLIEALNKKFHPKPKTAPAVASVPSNVQAATATTSAPISSAPAPSSSPSAAPVSSAAPAVAMPAPAPVVSSVPSVTAPAPAAPAPVATLPLPAPAASSSSAASASSISAHPAPVATTPPAVVAAPAPSPSAVTISPKGKTADLSDDLLKKFEAMTACGPNVTDRQTQTVCGWLQEFRTGRSPGLTIDTPFPWIGQAYAVDPYGRFVGLWIEIIQPSHGTIVHASFQPGSGLEDAAIRGVIDAKKDKKDPGAAPLLAIIANHSAPATFRTTNGASLALSTKEDETIYIRRSGDHLVMIAASGKRPEDYTLEPFKVAVLY